MSAKDNAVTVGGEPRIDLLPPEIRQKKQTRRTIRGLLVLVVAVLGLCLAAYAGITSVAIASQVALDRERERTQGLLRQQNEYAEARSASAVIDAAKNARLVASAPEVLWVPYLNAVAATLPADSFISVVSIDTLNVTEERTEPESEIELPRTGTITLVGSFATLSGVAAWLDNIESLRGFVGYAITPAVLEESGRYVISVDVHIDEGASELLYFENATPDEDVVDEETQP